MPMQFRHIEPHALLKGYIEKIWIFESSGKMPADDMKLVVPNGSLKLTLSYQNGVVAAVNGKTFSSREQDITLTGFMDVPVIIDADRDVSTETIGIEFSPRGAYRFFRFRLADIQNQIYSMDDLLGNTGRQLVEEAGHAASAQQKINVLQNFLLKQLALGSEDSLFEYSVEKILSSKGRISIKELEKKTGYSSRWLNMKFHEKLGVSLKTFSSIVRFKDYYSGFISGDERSFSRNDFYDVYYDQSHFIKEFKRFTGLSPTKFEKQINEFSKKYFS